MSKIHLQKDRQNTHKKLIKSKGNDHVKRTSRNRASKRLMVYNKKK